MVQPKSLVDPFELLRGLASRLERGFEQLADRGVRSNGFTRAMHRALAASLLARRLSRQVQDGLLGALNLPTRADVLLLGERLQALEDRIVALSADLAARDASRPGGMPRPALPSPPRTRKPPQSAALPMPRRRREKASP
jgi:hypothetical protein